MITIVDYGMGNLGSIKNMLYKAGYPAEITDEYRKIAEASKLILPGVGNFDTGMKNLKERNIAELLSKKVLSEKTPVLGICLGMQLMANKSEEGIERGLGWINAEVIRFRQESVTPNIRVPHIGWNFINWQRQTRLTENIPLPSRFYFVHAYHLHNPAEDWILGKTDYGYSFVSMIEKENIAGTQFHPEKSHKYGMTLLKNFAEKY